MLYDRDKYIEIVENIRKPMQPMPQFSEAIYKCPKCGNGMRMNFLGVRILTSNPPIQQQEYVCENCGFSEYI